MNAKNKRKEFTAMKISSSSENLAKENERFFRRHCGMHGGKWTNTILLLCLIVLSIFQIFNGQNSLHSRSQKRRSIRQDLEDADYKYENIDSNNNFDSSEESEDSLCSRPKTGKCDYMHRDLIGRLTFNASTIIQPHITHQNSGPCLSNGGCFTPPDCIPRQRVAILIPYKDREAHLYTLLNYLHPMLQRQHIHYCVFVVEQVDDGRFNKGLVMNSGFVEIMKNGEWDCVVFHDVDMIPEDDRNIYLCQNEPTHLSPLIDKFEYREHYGTEYGGVTMIKPDQYVAVNGYSNMFWGWGREDSDMEYRISRKGMTPLRPVNAESGRYSMIPHLHPWRFQNEKKNLGANTRMTTKEKLMTTKHERAPWDGITNVKYRLEAIEYNQLFTKINVDLRRFIVQSAEVVIDNQKPLTIIPLENEPCDYVEFEDTYLDSTFIKVLNKEQRRLYSFEEAKDLCNEIGQACAGFVKESNNQSGRNYFPREKAVLISSSTDEKIRNRNFVPTSVLKICPGDVSQNFPYDKSVASPIYKSKFSVDIAIPLSSSLVYRDMVLFEGLETGIEHEWPVPILANQTAVNQHIEFETAEFELPAYPGWYTVNAKISDRFDQTWFEWSFQFHVDQSICKDCKGTKIQYIEQLEQLIMDYKKKKSTDPKFQRDEKRRLLYLFSFEHDPDQSKAPSFESFMQQHQGHH